MSALRVSAPGVEVRFVHLGPDNGRSAKTAIGGGVIVRPGPSFPRRSDWSSRRERELQQQRDRRAKNKDAINAARKAWREGRKKR